MPETVTMWPFAEVCPPASRTLTVSWVISLNPRSVLCGSNEQSELISCGHRATRTPSAPRPFGLLGCCSACAGQHLPCISTTLRTKSKILPRPPGISWVYPQPSLARRHSLQIPLWSPKRGRFPRRLWSCLDHSLLLPSLCPTLADSSDSPC